MFVIPKPGLQCIDRGDIDTVDFSNIGNMTIDGNWHDMDWSSLVPAGTKYIDCMIQHTGPTVSDNIRFRRKGNANLVNSAFIINRTVNLMEFEVVRIQLNSDRIAEYNGTQTTLLALFISWIRAYK